MPGGLWQIPVIQALQGLGFFVVCADGTASPPAFAVADANVNVRLQDISALVAIGHNYGVNAVMTDQTDFAVPIVARVAQALGLRGLPLDVADAASDKARMRERAAAAGIRQPSYRECYTGDDVRAAVRSLGLPLFYKPVDGQSSRGVGILSDDSPAGVEAALARSLGSSARGAAIFEQYVRGTECTAEGFVVDGIPRTLAISSKTHYEDLPGVARTLTYPGMFPESVLRRIAAANEATVRALGMPFGITHAEFLVDHDGEPWLVEMAARGGGTRIASDIVPAVSGVRPVQALARILMGESPSVEPLARTRAAELRFLRLPAGRRVRRFHNLEALRHRVGVLDLRFNVRPGETIPPVGDDRSRHGFVVTDGESRDDAVARAAAVERDLEVEYEA